MRPLRVALYGALAIYLCLVWIVLPLMELASGGWFAAIPVLFVAAAILASYRWSAKGRTGRV